VSKDFDESIRCYGGISLEYSDIQEADFAAANGVVYSPPETGNFRRINIARTIQLVSDATGVVETFQTSTAIIRLPANTILDSTNDSGNGRLFFLKNSGVGDMTIQDYLGTLVFTVPVDGIVIVIGNKNNAWDVLEGARTKAGYITYTSFTGNPKTATVTFNPPFPDTNYSVVLSGNDKRTWSVDNQTASGFIINTGANQPITDRVFWQATRNWG
jgi:hypothetical protein